MIDIEEDYLVFSTRKFIEYEPYGEILVKKNASWIKQCEGKSIQQIRNLGFTTKRAWLVTTSEYRSYLFVPYKELSST